MSSIPTFTNQAQILEWLRQFASTGASVTTLMIVKTPYGVTTAEMDFAQVMHDAVEGLVPLPDRDALAKWFVSRFGAEAVVGDDEADALRAWLKGQPAPKEPTR